VTIQKIILSEAPAYKSKPLSIIKKHTLKPYLQIIDNESQLLFNSLNMEKINQLELYYTPHTEISDEIIIRCEHYKSEKERIPIFQININPSFISDDILRLTNKDIDISPEFKISDNFFIDIIFTSSKEVNIQGEILQHLKTECLLQASAYQSELLPERYTRDLEILDEEPFCGHQKDEMKSELFTTYPSTVADSRFVIDLDDEKFEDYINELNASM